MGQRHPEVCAITYRLPTLARQKMTQLRSWNFVFAAVGRAVMTASEKTHQEFQT